MAQGLMYLTPVLVCIGITFHPYIVAVACLVHVLLSETSNNEEGTETLHCRFIMSNAWGYTVFQRSAA
jgi:hypothetical protein